GPRLPRRYGGQMKNFKAQHSTLKEASMSNTQVPISSCLASSTDWLSEGWRYSGCWLLKLGLFAALCLALTIHSSAAQTLLLSGATVHTVSGETLANGKVLIENGKIAAVGTSVSGSGAQTIELTGQHLYPGLIALNTTLGLQEIGAVRATLDSTEAGEGY